MHEYTDYYYQIEIEKWLIVWLCAFPIEKFIPLGLPKNIYYC